MPNIPIQVLSCIDATLSTIFCSILLRLYHQPFLWPCLPGINPLYFCSTTWSEGCRRLWYPGESLWGLRALGTLEGQLDLESWGELGISPFIDPPPSSLRLKQLWPLPTTRPSPSPPSAPPPLESHFKLERRVWVGFFRFLSIHRALSTPAAFL